MQQMLNSPQMEAIMQNPDVMRSLFNANPQVKALMESNPEIARALNDPEIMRQSFEAARNPAMMREMMRNTDRAMGNIESIPGGFNALKKLYEEVQEPLWEAQASMNTGAMRSSSVQQTAPSSGPLPNPWAPTSAGPSSAGLSSAPPPSGPQFDPSAMAAMMQDPGMQQLMAGQFGTSRPFGNPDFMRALFDPQAMNAMAGLQGALINGGSAPGGAPLGISETYSQSFGSFLSAANNNPEVRFKTQLQALRSMGFTDTAANLRALEASGGNINRAIDLLIQQASE